MFRNIFRGSQRVITTLARPSALRQTPMLCREALVRQPKQMQRPYAAVRSFACTRQYSSQSKVAVNSGSDANGGNGANGKTDSTTKRGIICRVAARAERKKHLALICRAPERAGRGNQLAHIHRVPPRRYRKHQLALRTRSQTIQMKKRAREKKKALRQLSEKLDKLEMDFDKTEKQERYMFWKLVLATIVMAVVGAMIDPTKPKKQENETAGEISPDTSPTPKEDPDIVS